MVTESTTPGTPGGSMVDVGYAWPAGEDEQDNYGDVEALFVRLREAGSDEQRKQRRCDIIMRCLPLADHIAYRFVGRGEPGEDLIQVARLGLVKTVDRYQPDKGRFLSFAVPTIMGEVRRYFRDNSSTLRVPRQLKETGQRIRTAIDPLSQRLGRPPTVGELAAELGVARRDVEQCLQAGSARRPVSLDATAPGRDGGERTIGATWGSEDPRYQMVEQILSVADLLTKLPERERAILRMRYCESLTQKEIAERVGISQVHVSRLLTMTLDRLRQQL